MAKPLGNPDPLIPSVFVSEKAGTVMQKMVLAGEVFAEIMPVRPFNFFFAKSATSKSQSSGSSDTMKSLPFMTVSRPYGQ